MSDPLTGGSALSTTAPTTSSGGSGATAELQPRPIICGECYADHCWRCEGECDCPHPDNGDDE